MEQVHAERGFGNGETIPQQQKALQLLQPLVRNRVVVVPRETRALMVGCVRGGRTCRLLDKTEVLFWGTAAVRNRAGPGFVGSC